MRLTRTHTLIDLQVLDMEWAPVVCRGNFDLLHLLQERRYQHVVDCCPTLKPCPNEHCDLVVRYQRDNLSTRGPPLEEPLPQVPYPLPLS